MKTFTFVILFLASVSSLKVSAQGTEIQQLLLNVEKLAQLKQILTDMKKGYEIVSAGYNTIKNISQGNFDLHKTFLDDLLKVSPTVRNYKRVAEIIQSQVMLVKEYKNASIRFKQSGSFSADEIKYLGQVYTNLFKQSLKNVDDLITVITSGSLRMSDDERLKAIDTIYAAMQEKLLFLRQFNNDTTILALQRAGEKKNLNAAKILYGLTQ